MSPRSYHSPAREQQAARTRSTILEAARTCFLENGFARTSVAEIARRAGVSSQTVHAHVGTKAALVAAMVTRLEDEAGVDAWRARLDSAGDGVERLTAWAGWTVSMLSPAREVKQVCREAAAEPTMLDLKALGDAHRREALTGLMTSMRERGELRPDLSVDHAVDQAWLLTGLEVYLGATDCGWDDEEIRAWLAATLVALLLPR